MHHAFDDQRVIPAIGEQLGFLLGDDADLNTQANNGVYFSAPDIDLSQYEKFIVSFSGGKDSVACLLHLLDLGVDPRRIELWHMDVDGREGSTLMDWPFMASYNEKFAKAFNLPYYGMWLEGGFEGEMTKQNAYGKPHHVETPDGLITLERDIKRAKPGTRMKFPQVSANLQTRWCSSSCKIDVGRRALNNQSRFDHQNILFVTGERREESNNRAKYNQLEPHACDRRRGRKKRLVDAWRPVLHWDEAQVWDIMERHGVLAPVPYRLGWSRSSCMNCIFNNATIWATLRHYFPGSLDKIAGYEDQFGTTISRDRINVIDVSNRAQPLEINDQQALEQAMVREYTLPILAGEWQSWEMPMGAFKRDGCGPS